MKKINDKRLMIAKKMPPLRKRLPGADYDISQDEVLNWIMDQPELINFFVDRLSSWGCIVYDSPTGTWRGADYHDN